LDKIVTFAGKSDKGIFTHLLDYERSYLEKTASEYHPTIASYINAAKPIKGKTQILLTALGAGEWWGDNANGDYFPESELAHEGPDYGYKTFEHYAKIYKHHVNKDPTASFGDVPLSIYNPVFHRVELIVLLDNAKAPDIAQRVENGDYPDWSMGTRVPFDICSICGNKAPSRATYCEHARYYMGKIHPESGKKVYVRNVRPRFFDISYVLIGADRIAKTLRKVAHVRPDYMAMGSAEAAEKMAARAKSAAITKEVPGGDAPSSQDEVKESIKTLLRSIPEVKAREKVLPPEVMDRLSSLPLERSLSTMTMLGIVPKPQEFQRLFLIAKGLRQLADLLDQRNLCFDPMLKDEPSQSDMDAFDISHRHFDPFALELLRPHMEGRSYAAPHLGKRIVMIVKTAAPVCEEPIFIKASAEKDGKKPIGIMPVMIAAAGAYAALAKKAPVESLKGIDKLLQSDAGLGLAAALGIGLLSVFHNTFGPKVKGQFTPGKYENPDANDVFARIEQMKQKPYLKLASVSLPPSGVAANLGAAGKRLFLGIPAAYMASGVFAKHREINPYEEEGRMKSFVRQHPDLISGALIADAMLSARGRGSRGLINKLAPKVVGKTVGRFAKAAEAVDEIFGTEFAKTADAQDFLTNAVTWPLAIGKANLPGRIVGGLFDQAVLETSGKLLSKRKEKAEKSSPAS